jgi:Ca-activated chloride channel family protein
MKSFGRFIVFVCFLCVFLTLNRNHRRITRRVILPGISSAPSAPAHADRAAEQRGFNNRLWYGKDTDKDIDALLTRRNFLIVLDGSGSMADSQCSGNLSKIVAAKQAIAAFATKIKPEDNLGLCAFDSRGVTERAPLSLNRGSFNQALQAVRSDSNTPLGRAVKLGYSLLQKQAQRQLGYGEYYLVVVTDGEADRGDDPRDIVNKIVSESPVIISTIGFCIGEGHSLHRPGMTLYHDATNLEQLNQGLESVLAESEFSDTPAAR